MGGADYKNASLILVRPNGSSQIIAEGLAFANDKVISTGQRNLIVNKRSVNRISQFDFEEDGTLGTKRDFAIFVDLASILLCINYHQSWTSAIFDLLSE